MRLSRATALNLTGLGTPMLLALICFPVLLQRLGQERFGLLSLLWVLMGSAALFDLGLGRALTLMLAQALGSGATESIRDRARAGLIALSCVGLFFALVMLAASGAIVPLVDLSAVSPGELHQTLRISSAAIAFVVVGSAVSCGLEAFQRFDLSNALRVLVGIGTIGGTTVASFFTTSLPALACVLALSRMVAVAVGTLLFSRLLRPFPAPSGVKGRHLGEFIRFGRWITAGNLLSPVLAFGDRLALSVLVPAGSLAYYVVPYDIISRLLVFPGAVVSALFPMLSANTNGGEIRRLSKQATGVIVGVMGALLLLFFMLAEFGLSVWISSEFAERSALIAQILCIGAFFNSVARTPFVLLQSQGWAKSIVIVQVFQVPLFFMALYFAATSWSVLGVAVAWTGRMALDCFLLWLLALKKMRCDALEAHFSIGRT